jgi:small subunit ribosomal protein S1
MTHSKKTRSPAERAAAGNGDAVSNAPSDPFFSTLSDSSFTSSGGEATDDGRASVPGGETAEGSEADVVEVEMEPAPAASTGDAGAGDGAEPGAGTGAQAHEEALATTGEVASTVADVGAAAGAPEEVPIDPAIAAALHAATAAAGGPSLRVGKRLKAKIVQIGETDCFLDFGGRSEGTLPLAEMKDAQGQLKHQVGEELEVAVKQLGDVVLFTLARKGPPPILGKLQQSFEQGAPVQGLVRKTNKGGFDVSLRGARAFCPMSQIELGHCTNPEQYVGQKLQFAIITFERGGRNIVVSHRKVLEAQAKEAATRTRERLAVGQAFDGVVRRIQPYGAFVDIGGLDGLLHVSEISRTRIINPADVLKVGQTVQVKVIRVESQGTDKERISLSMKDFEPDPWSDIANLLKEGEVVKGRVVRLTDFGAFVQLNAGIDGLIHISEISRQRIIHPKDVLAVGQELDVRVLKVDPEKQRVSLSLRGLTEEEPEPAPPPRRELRPRSDRGEQAESGPRRRLHREESESDGDGSVAQPMNYDEKLEALKRKFNVRA